MKKISSYSIIAFALLIVVAGCNKEAGPTPGEPYLSFEFPQGSNAYDQRIMEFQKNNGAYILYKFSYLDFRYNVTSYITYIAENAEEGYVDASLDSLQSHLFGYYDPALLKKLLPQKILLSSLIRRIRGTAENILDTFPAPINAVQAINHISFGHAGSRLAALTQADWDTVRGDLHYNCWLNSLTAGKLTVPPAFYSGIDYTKVTAGNYKTFGIIEFDPSNKPNAAKDFATWVKYITSRTKAELDNGILNPATDTQSKYRNRYNFIINYFQSEYGMDLQAIGSKQ